MNLGQYDHVLKAYAERQAPEHCERCRPQSAVVSVPAF
jgi:hypothetical protein